MTHSHDHDHAAPFAAPGHDHRACAATLIARAERLCAARGARLTDMRRRVLEALAADHVPAGAYDVIERVAREGERRPAPITVYRALDFLLAHGLAHRIESRNAFVACSHEHGPGDGGPVAFLICESCGAVGEASSSAFAAALDALAGEAGFRARSQVVEISGECSHCRAAAAPKDLSR
ncbi:Fur family transcriptional regulator [Methylopila musalis]|uniref:Fur family transcriptional regulator n=1 Tax=Methylopila musalis TaxID=1134781 RepID=A0ABW3ZCH5_9HYPH